MQTLDTHHSMVACSMACKACTPVCALGVRAFVRIDNCRASLGLELSQRREEKLLFQLSQCDVHLAADTNSKRSSRAVLRDESTLRCGYVLEHLLVCSSTYCNTTRALHTCSATYSTTRVRIRVPILECHGTRCTTDVYEYHLICIALNRSIFFFNFELQPERRKKCSTCFFCLFHSFTRTRRSSSQSFKKLIVNP